MRRRLYFKEPDPVPTPETNTIYKFELMPLSQEDTLYPTHIVVYDEKTNSKIGSMKTLINTIGNCYSFEWNISSVSLRDKQFILYDSIGTKLSTINRTYWGDDNNFICDQIKDNEIKQDRTDVIQVIFQCDLMKPETYLMINTIHDVNSIDISVDKNTSNFQACFWLNTNTWYTIEGDSLSHLREVRIDQVSYPVNNGYIEFQTPNSYEMSIEYIV